ncbi:MAG: replication factor C large subunit [Nitrosarchaeum sp.]|nr:replication factor C large subunit [Nitrosarchaeum sp.]
MIWTEKYKPKSLKEVAGNKDNLRKLEDFVLNHKMQKKNSVILHGLTGTGKTCAVHAIAKENSLELMELNASDFRNKNQINEIIGNAIDQASLFSRGKIILVDEIDGLDGTKDRGGVQALLLLLTKSTFPIVLTANDVMQDKLSSLRSKSILLEFEEIKTEEIFNVLKKIVMKENINIDEAFLKKLSNNAGGDLRGAITDLQVLCSLKSINDQTVSYLDNRNKEEKIFALLRLIFKSRDINAVSRTVDSVDISLDEIFLWIDENLPLEYHGMDLSEAYDKLSKADVFRGRIRRGQYWRFLVYQKFLMSEGVALLKINVNKNYINYKRTQRLLKIWRANMLFSKRKTICKKIGSKLHISYKRALKDVYPYINHLLNKKEFYEKFDFDEEEIQWLKKNSFRKA